jgi:hypothetical protein
VGNQSRNRDLPQAFISRQHDFEDAYLTSDDPIRQAGFSVSVRANASSEETRVCSNRRAWLKSKVQQQDMRGGGAVLKRNRS